jgi:pimeloyl-ACP methyl ester carboxylesterase
MAHPAATPDGAPRSFTVESDGLTIAVLDWGGAPDSRPVVLLHPNGFCAGLFDPIARRLAARGTFRPIGVDLRGHGGTDKPEPPDPYHYEGMASDVIAVLDAMGFHDVDIVGGSLGGGVAIHVDRKKPGRARRLVLCEPIALAGTDDRSPDQAHPLAVGALRRKVVWPSHDAMIHSYGSRPPMNRLAPEALAAYVNWGTIDRPDGQVELACPPAVEAAIFGSPMSREGVHAAWDHLPHLTASAAVLAGDRSFVAFKRFEGIAAAAGVPLEVVAGDHFFLHEDTTRAVALIEGHLA